MVLGLSPSNRPSPQTPQASSAPQSSIQDDVASTAASAPEPIRYVPDLSGADVGSTIVEAAVDAHGLAIVGDRLTWLTTDGAALSSARLDGSDVVALFDIDDDQWFGGAFGHGPNAVYWTVGSIGDELEPIRSLRADGLTAKGALGPALAEGSSPDHLLVLQDRLFWSDLGNIVSGDGTTVAVRDKRIVSMSGCDDTLYWIEAPYRGLGDHALMGMASGDGEAKIIARLSAASRDQLRCSGGSLYWFERRNDDRDRGLHSVPRAGGRPARLIATGLVTSLQMAGSRLVWAEVHGEDDEAVSLLRSAPLGGGEPQRIGRDSGTITALAIGQKHLYWSGRSGIKRLRQP